MALHVKSIGEGSERNFVILGKCLIVLWLSSQLQLRAEYLLHMGISLGGCNGHMRHHV